MNNFDYLVKTIGKELFQQLNTILAAFAAVGKELEFFPADRKEGTVEMWQHDGYNHDGCSNFVVIQFTLGFNGRCEVSLFGHYEAISGNTFSLSSPIRDWMENFGEYLPAIGKGKDLKF